MIDVLIVDDSPTASYVLKHMLDAMGYKTEIANDGIEVEMLTLKFRPQVILMDLVMPHMDGFQATRLLKKNKDLEKIPVIICSSNNKKTDQYWAKLQGAAGFIGKPVNKLELKKLLETVMEKGKANECPL